MLLKTGSSPNRFKPVPILMNIIATALTASTPLPVCVANMIAIAFFFLLHPGEYTGSSSESNPFRLANIQLFHMVLSISTKTLPLIPPFSVPRSLP